MISELLKNLFIVEREYNFFINKRLREFGIKKTEIKVLKNLRIDAGMSQNEICAVMKEDKVTIAKSAKKLEELGYIVKETDPRDRRITVLTLTEKGEELRLEIQRILDDLEDILLEGFTPEDRDTALGYLARLRENSVAKSERLI